LLLYRCPLTIDHLLKMFERDLLQHPIWWHFWPEKQKDRKTPTTPS